MIAEFREIDPDFLVEVAGSRSGIWSGLFADLPTVRDDAITIGGTGANRCEIWRSGDNLAARIQGDIAADNLLKLYWEPSLYTLLRIRRMDDKLQYQLNGRINTATTLRVYRFVSDVGGAGGVAAAHAHIDHTETTESVYLTSDWQDIVTLPVDIDVFGTEIILSVSTQAQLVYGNEKNGVIYGRLLHGSRVPVENSEQAVLYGEAPKSVDGLLVIQAAVLYRKIVQALFTGETEFIFQARESSDQAQGLLYRGCTFEGQVIR